MEYIWTFTKIHFLRNNLLALSYLRLIKATKANTSTTLITQLNNINVSVLLCLRLNQLISILPTPHSYNTE